MSISDELARAIAELAKAGMAFTTDTTRDGQKFYIVDSIALTEEELVLLHRNGALTQQGIRHYLVYRAALGAHVDTTAHIPFVTFFQYLLQAAPLSPERRTHLENCAECQALAEELTHTDRGTIPRPDRRPARTKAG